MRDAGDIGIFARPADIGCERAHGESSVDLVYVGERHHR